MSEQPPEMRLTGLAPILGFFAFLALCLVIATMVFTYQEEIPQKRFVVSVLVALMLATVVVGFALAGRAESRQEVLLPLIGNTFSGLTVSLYLLISAMLLASPRSAEGLAEALHMTQEPLYLRLWGMLASSFLVAFVANGLVKPPRHLLLAYSLAVGSLLLALGMFVKYLVWARPVVDWVIQDEIVTFVVANALFVFLYFVVGGVRRRGQGAAKGGRS